VLGTKPAVLATVGSARTPAPTVVPATSAVAPTSDPGWCFMEASRLDQRRPGARGSPGVGTGSWVPGEASAGGAGLSSVSLFARAAEETRRVRTPAVPGRFLASRARDRPCLAPEGAPGKIDGGASGNFGPTPTVRRMAGPLSSPSVMLRHESLPVLGREEQRRFTRARTGSSGVAGEDETSGFDVGDTASGPKGGGRAGPAPRGTLALSAVWRVTPPPPPPSPAPPPRPPTPSAGAAGAAPGGTSPRSPGTCPRGPVPPRRRARARGTA